MKIDLEKALTYPTEDKKWVMKLGVIYVIQMLLVMASSLFNITSQIVSTITPFLGESGGDWLTGNTMLVALIFGGLALAFISIPFRLYFTGYYAQTMENVMDGKKYPLPEHNNFLYKFKLMASLFLVALGPIMLFIIITAVLWVPVLVMFISGFDTNIALSFLSIFGGIFLVMIMVGGSLFLGMVLIPAMTYIFFETDSIFAAYNYSDIVTVIKIGWKEFVIVSLIVTAVSTIGQMVTFFLGFCLVGYFLNPIVIMVTQLIYSYLMGSVYKEIDDQVHLG